MLKKANTINYNGFSGGSAGKESTCNARDLGLIPGLGRSPGEGNSYPLQYSGLENSMDCIVHGVTKNRAQLSILIIKMDEVVKYFKELQIYLLI